MSFPLLQPATARALRDPSESSTQRDDGHDGWTQRPFSSSREYFYKEIELIVHLFDRVPDRSQPSFWDFTWEGLLVYANVLGKVCGKKVEIDMEYISQAQW